MTLHIHLLCIQVNRDLCGCAPTRLQTELRCEVWLGAAASATVNTLLYALTTNSSDNRTTAGHDDYVSSATHAKLKQSSPGTETDM